MADITQRDMLKNLDDRHGEKSTLITNQLPVQQWHAYLGGRAMAARSSIGWCTTAAR